MRAFSFLGIAAIFGVLCYYVYVQGEQNLDKTRKQSIEQTPQASNMGAVEDSASAAGAAVESPGEQPVILSEPEAPQLTDPADLPPPPAPLPAEPIAGKEMEGKVITEAPAPPPEGEKVVRLESKVTVIRAWARPVNNPTGAAYLTLNNQGEGDRLLSAGTDIADSVEIHQTYEEDGIMKMRAEPVLLPPGSTVTLGPGGAHIMLIGLKKPLKAGDRFSLKLQFERGEQTVDVTVGAGL